MILTYKNIIAAIDQYRQQQRDKKLYRDRIVQKINQLYGGKTFYPHEFQFTISIYGTSYLVDVVYSHVSNDDQRMTNYKMNIGRKIAPILLRFSISKFTVQYNGGKNYFQFEDGSYVITTLD